MNAAGSAQALEAAPPPFEKGWRFYAGMTALILALVMPFLGLTVPLLGLSAAMSATLIGVLLAGGPEVMILVAAALLGKETVHYFMAKAKRKLLKVILAKPVSKARYYTGLTIAVASILPLYLYGYFPDVMPPNDVRIYILAAADLSFIVSMFVMGGEFWEKLGAMFRREGKFDAPPPASPSNFSGSQS